MSHPSHVGQASGTLAGVRVWDGEQDIGPHTISWADGMITAVQAADADPDLRGYCALPGLVDTHVHLMGYAGPHRDGGPDTFGWPLVTTREEQVLHAAANAIHAMAAGITTLRDLAADDAHASLMRVFDDGVLSGPRLQCSGPVGMTAGHLDLFTPAAVADRPPVADSPDECHRLVRRWARAGLTGIKIYTSGGVLSKGDRPAWRNHTRAEIAATIDEAHALGMLVAAHAHTADGIAVALQEGADSIEHASGVTAEQAEMLAVRRIPVGPTLLINEIIAQGRSAGSAAADKAAAVLADRDDRFRAAADAGVRFVLGTDASGYFVRFGDQWAELRRMVEVFGWDAARALRSATSDAADSIGLGGITGRLRPGLGADLLLMRGDPDRSTPAFDPANLQAVVCRGRLVTGSLP